MDQVISAPYLALSLLVGMLLFLELGRRVGLARPPRDPDAASSGTGVVDGAVFGLLGLLIAFTFSGANARYDARRHQIAEEANAIGTAWLRLDLVTGADREALRSRFRAYLDSRLEAYRLLPNLEAAKAELGRTAAIQDEIWRHALPATRAEGAHPDAAKLLLPALNQMFDVAAERTMTTRIHPPLAVFAFLAALGFAAALLAGHAMAASRDRSWLHVFAFAATMAIAVYLTVDLEYPRFGMLRIDAFEQVLRDLRTSMG